MDRSSQHCSLGMLARADGGGVAASGDSLFEFPRRPELTMTKGLKGLHGIESRMLSRFMQISSEIPLGSVEFIPK